MTPASLESLMIFHTFSMELVSFPRFPAHTEVHGRTGWEVRLAVLAVLTRPSCSCLEVLVTLAPIGQFITLAPSQLTCPSWSPSSAGGGRTEDKCPAGRCCRRCRTSRATSLRCWALGLSLPPLWPPELGSCQPSQFLTHGLFRLPKGSPSKVLAKWF